MDKWITFLDQFLVGSYSLQVWFTQLQPGNLLACSSEVNNDLFLKRLLGWIDPAGLAELGQTCGEQG